MTLNSVISKQAMTFVEGTRIAFLFTVQGGYSLTSVARTPRALDSFGSQRRPP